MGRIEEPTETFHIDVGTDPDRARGALRAIDPSSIPAARALFALFGEPAWTVQCQGRDDGGTWMTLQLSGRGTWFARSLARAYLRRLRRALGTPVFNAALPGDELLHDVRYQRTHARTIEAPPEKVWPWLTQMGCRRAGWYSYDFLDNGRVHSADQIVPALQELHVGDLLPAVPTDPAGFAVLRIDRPRSLVLGSPDLLRRGPPVPGWTWSVTWSFVLEPIGADATNLIVRVRAQPARPVKHVAHLIAPVALAHEIMERAQLRHLKRRVETVV